MNIGDNIRKIRKEKGLSMKSLGKIVGVSEQAIGNYERGDREPSIDILLKISQALNVQFRYLLGETDCINRSSDFIYSDLKELSQITENSNNEVARLIEDIVSSCTSTIKKYALNNDIEILKNVSNIYSLLFKITLIANEYFIQNFLDTNLANVDTENYFLILKNSLVLELEIFYNNLKLREKKDKLF